MLQRKGVRLHLGVAVTEIGAGHVTLADGTTIRTRCVVWGGGIMAPALAATAGLAAGRGGRIESCRTSPSTAPPGVYAIGDVANIPARTAQALSAARLGGAAERHVGGGQHARRRRPASRAPPFHYHDKGIMAMIGRGAAIAEVGAHRHELHGAIAFSAWLGVHAALMTGVRNRVDAFVDWGWDYFTSTRGPQVLDRADAAADRLGGRPASGSSRHDAVSGSDHVSTLASTTVDLARLQFAATSIYHFLFVPLTLGLAPLVAIMQTLWHRTGMTTRGCG